MEQDAGKRGARAVWNWGVLSNAVLASVLKRRPVCRWNRAEPRAEALRADFGPDPGGCSLVPDCPRVVLALVGGRR